MPRQPQRGDFTGQQVQKLQEENLTELAGRQGEIGLVNQVDFVVETEGVFDPATGDVVDLSPEARAEIDRLSAPATVEEDPILDPHTAPGQPYNPMKDLRPTESQQATRPRLSTNTDVEDLGPEPIVVEDEWRVIRVNTDIEDMTYGAGNYLTFLRGRRYRVPRHLAEWLESRGIVYH